MLARTAMVALVLLAACGNNSAAPTPQTRDALLVFRLHVGTVFTGGMLIQSDTCIVTVGAKVVRDPQYKVVPPYGDSIGSFSSAYYAWVTNVGAVAIPFDSTHMSWAPGIGLSDTFTVTRHIPWDAHHQDAAGASVDTILGGAYPGNVTLYWFETFAGDSGNTRSLPCGASYYKADTTAEKVPVI